jgi:hypothetical protein
MEFKVSGIRQCHWPLTSDQTPPAPTQIFKISSGSSLLRIEGSVGMSSFPILMDTGAEVSAIRASNAREAGLSWSSCTHHRINNPNGAPLSVAGIAHTSVMFDIHAFPVDLFVINDLQEHMLLGSPFFRQYEATLDIAKNSISVTTSSSRKVTINSEGIAVTSLGLNCLSEVATSTDSPPCIPSIHDSETVSHSLGFDYSSEETIVSAITQSVELLPPESYSPPTASREGLTDSQFETLNKVVSGTTHLSSEQQHHIDCLIHWPRLPMYSCLKNLVVSSARSFTSTSTVTLVLSKPCAVWDLQSKLSLKKKFVIC